MVEPLKPFKLATQHVDINGYTEVIHLRAESDEWVHFTVDFRVKRGPVADALLAEIRSQNHGQA
jgi:hypothetical protein